MIFCLHNRKGVNREFYILRRGYKKLIRLNGVKACDLGGFEPRTIKIALFDFLFQARGHFGRQPKADMNGFFEAGFKRFVIYAERMFKRAYHITDDIFRRVMEQRREAFFLCGFRI